MQTHAMISLGKVYPPYTTIAVFSVRNMESLEATNRAGESYTKHGDHSANATQESVCGLVAKNRRMPCNNNCECRCASLLLHDEPQDDGTLPVVETVPPAWNQPPPATRHLDESRKPVDQVGDGCMPGRSAWVGLPPYHDCTYCIRPEQWSGRHQQPATQHRQSAGARGNFKLPPQLA
jgi:hypothetical protein